MHDFFIVVRHRRRSATGQQLNASMRVVKTTNVLDSLYSNHKTSVNESLPCLDTFFGIKALLIVHLVLCLCFATLSQLRLQRSVPNCDRQMHLTDIAKMPTIPIWYKQWCCDWVNKQIILNIIYMRCGCIIASCIVDLDGG